MNLAVKLSIVEIKLQHIMRIVVNALEDDGPIDTCSENKSIANLLAVIEPAIRIGLYEIE